jgi:hypothetical protein
LAGHSPASSSWIAISHDIQDKTVHGFVQYMIDQARNLKYQLVTLGECLGDPPSNWYRDPNNGQPYTGTNLRPQAAVIPVSSSASASVGSKPTTIATPQFGAGTGAQAGGSVSPNDSSLATSTSKALAPARTHQPKVFRAVHVVIISSFVAVFI